MADVAVSPPTCPFGLALHSEVPGAALANVRTWAARRSSTRRAFFRHPDPTVADPMDATTEKALERRRCRARSKRSGERCRRLAIPGGTVCVMHGGAAPQVAAAARRRLSDAAARELLPRIAPDAVGRVRPPEPHDADVTHAFERLCRARARQPRWWLAVDARNDRAYLRAVFGNALRLLEDELRPDL